MTAKKIIATKDAPAAVGPYSQGVAANGLLFVSGQVPIDPVKGEIVSESISEQAEQALKNLENVLKAGGAALSDVVKTTCFLKDINDFAAFNKVYGKYFNENPPARACVQAVLPLGAKVEIEAIAITQPTA